MFPSTKAAALGLGYAGLIPFVFLAVEPLVLGLEENRPVIERALLGYAAVILSFLGGIVWGRSFARPDVPNAMIVSVLPSLAGWAALVLGGVGGLLLCAAGFAAMLAYDLGADLPPWFRKLRLHLSIGAIASLLFAAVAV